MWDDFSGQFRSTSLSRNARSAFYPYAVGFGFKGETDEENIRIIREAIDANTPVVLTPDYGANQDY